MAVTEIIPIHLKNRNKFIAETSDTDFVAVDANDGATLEIKDKAERYLIGVKNDVVVANYYVECESTDTGALLVKASGAGTGEINYNNEALVKADGTALYAEAPTNKYVLKVSGTKQVTIKANDVVFRNPQDITVDVAHNGIAWVQVDTMEYKNLSGTNKGKVVITATDAHILVKAIRLP